MVVVIHGDVAHVALVLRSVHQRQTLILPIQAETSCKGDSCVEVIRLGTIGFDKQYAIGTQRTPCSCLSTGEQRDVGNILRIHGLEERARITLHECRLIEVGHIGHAVDDDERVVFAGKATDSTHREQ